MKQSISGLIDRYRCADGNTRLHLYLQYPDLRTEFIEVDRSDLCRNERITFAASDASQRFQKATFSV